MKKIKEFTMCLHCGSDETVVARQMRDVAPDPLVDPGILRFDNVVEQGYQIHWNNRIDRYPKLYDSYSLMINHAIATSPTEYMVLVNDRCVVPYEKLVKLIGLMEEGQYAFASLWNVACMAFSKELVRKIGWFDERYTLGGYDDNDWFLRLKEANLAIYESNDIEYEHHWKSPLNGPLGCTESAPHWQRKWGHTNTEIKRNLPEESYPHWDLSLWKDNPQISARWGTWEDSVLARGTVPPHAGPYQSTNIGGRTIS